MVFWCFSTTEKTDIKEIIGIELTQIAVDLKPELLEIMRCVCEITVALLFKFRLMLCRLEDVSFSNMFEGIQQLYLMRWFRKYRSET